MQRVQRNAVLWFSEVVRRKLYRELGYSSVYQYAELELGFKKSKTAQFLRLSESLRELPALRRAVTRKKLSWTKAREVAKVATQRKLVGSRRPSGLPEGFWKSEWRKRGGRRGRGRDRQRPKGCWI